MNRYTVAPPFDSTSASTSSISASGRFNGPGATAVRSAWSRTWSRGSGSSGARTRAAAAAAVACSAGDSGSAAGGAWWWTGSLSPGPSGSGAGAFGAGAPSSARPCVDSAPRPVTPSSSASDSVHRAIRARRPSSGCGPRSGRSQPSRASTDSADGEVPSGSPASRLSTRCRTSGAAERSSPGPSADNVRSFASRPPTTPDVRVAVSHACASRDQRSAAGCSSHSSWSGVAAYRSSASPSEANRPAA